MDSIDGFDPPIRKGDLLLVASRVQLWLIGGLVVGYFGLRWGPGSIGEGSDLLVGLPLILGLIVSLSGRKVTTEGVSRWLGGPPRKPAGECRWAYPLSICWRRNGRWHTIRWAGQAEFERLIDP